MEERLIPTKTNNFHRVAFSWFSLPTPPPHTHTSEYEQKEPEYLLWGCFYFRPSSASASTPAGCLKF
jgi:hypothetical protein